MSDPQPKGRELVGDFAAADDLLWAAESGHDYGPVRVRQSGRIGPLIEIVQARRYNPQAFAAVTPLAPFAAAVEKSIAHDEISGEHFRARTGVFPLRRYVREGGGHDLWELWASRAERAAVEGGLPKLVAAGIIAAWASFGRTSFFIAASLRRASLPMRRP